MSHQHQRFTQNVGLNYLSAFTGDCSQPQTLWECMDGTEGRCGMVVSRASAGFVCRLVQTECNSCAEDHAAAHILCMQGPCSLQTLRS